MLFALGVGMNYLTAPVLYVGPTQSALIEKLGGSTVAANLPATLFFGMTAIPALYAWAWPQISLLKRNMTICYSLCGIMLAATALTLRMDVSNQFKILMVILQGGVTGAVMPATTAYLWEVVSRGSDASRRGLALGMAFGAGPLLAVIGSLVQVKLLGGTFFGMKFLEPEGVEGYVNLFGICAPVLGLAVIFGLMLIIPPPDKEPEREPVAHVVGMLIALPAMMGFFLIRYWTDIIDQAAAKSEALPALGGLDLPFLHNVALLRGVGVACTIIATAGFLYHFRSILRQRTLRIATVVTILVYCGNMMPSNMNLYSAEVLQEPTASDNAETSAAPSATKDEPAAAKKASGLPTKYVAMQNTLKFSFKTVAGLLLGWLLTRTNPRAGILATSTVFLLAALWAMTATGPWYLLAFGIYGAGELVGVYAPNYIVTASHPHELRKNTAFMTLLMVPTAPAGVLYATIVAESKARGWTWQGMNPATFGFRLSFLVAGGLIVSGILLTLILLPKDPREPEKG